MTGCCPMKRLFRFCCALCLGATLSGLPVAQEMPEPIRVEVEAVNVLVSISDGDGKFVKDLNAEDFEVYEDGVLQEIRNFSRQTDLPLTIAMAVDTSSSVRIKLDFEKEAALEFLYTIMRPTDRALLAEFDTGVTLLHDYTSNPNDLAREIKNLKAGGSTSLYDAIYLIAEQKMLDEPGRRVMIILSDGSDVSSRATFDEALRMAQLAEMVVFAVSTTRIGANIDHTGDNALRQIADTTGGRVLFPYSAAQLSEAFKEIEEELRSQYNLTYVPSNDHRDGSFRNIEVKVKQGGLKVRHRKGYFAPDS
jgi:Ca-activated chloride channel homolog